MERLTFDVYRQFRVQVERAARGWRALRIGSDGKRALLEVEIPPELPASELAAYLDDQFHECARPGDSVRLVGG